MYADYTRTPILDDSPYVNPENGTRYPASYPKDQIRGLRPVTLTEKPTDPDKVVTGFIINEQYVQVWQTRDKTADDIAAEKEALKAYLANYRYEAETGGLNGIQTDRETRANLVSARTLAKEDANYTVKWKAANGAFVTLNAAQIIATADAVAAFVAKCFASEESVATAIDAGTHTTEAEVKTAFDTAMQA